MKSALILLAVGALLGAAVVPAAAADKLAPIKKVEIGKNRELLVNGTPFLPIMSWAQDPKNFAMLRGLGFNAFCGNQSNVTAKMQCDAAQEAGGYGIPDFGEDGQGAIGHPNLLAWIHGDEPDMPKVKSDAVVEPAKHMNVNKSTPYTRLVDGGTGSWTAIQPLEGGEFTIRLEKPVTVGSLGVWLTISGNLSVAKEIEFRGDGKLVLTAALENKKGRQKFDLPQPATFKHLAVKVTSAYAGEANWGSIGEIEGFDAEGKNLLLSKSYYVPRQPPDEIAAVYRKIKTADPSRPVFMTFTTTFMKEHRGKYDEAMQEKVYSEYVKYCEVPGFDLYPIYGANYPSHLNWPAFGVDQLRAFAGPDKPIYVWIETHKGSQWVTFENQLDVLPKHTRYEVWSVLIRGATAVGYFTHRWRPDFKEFAPTAEMQAELKRLNDQLTRLAAAILAAPAKRKVAMQLAGNLPCHFKATEHDGSLYVFAQNMDLGEEAHKLRQGQDITPRGGQATITVEGLKAGTRIEVVDEDRTIAAEAGKFADDFGPLAEHIYRIKL